MDDESGIDIARNSHTGRNNDLLSVWPAAFTHDAIHRMTVAVWTA